MATPSSPTADEVLDMVRAALAAPAATGRSALRARLEHARGLQRAFRAEPVGGKLSALKKLVFWFVASSFDRQAKAVEALLDAVEELVDATERAASAGPPGEERP